jgi:hypothetical protein
MAIDIGAVRLTEARFSLPRESRPCKGRAPKVAAADLVALCDALRGIGLERAEALEKNQAQAQMAARTDGRYFPSSTVKDGPVSATGPRPGKGTAREPVQLVEPSAFRCKVAVPLKGGGGVTVESGDSANGHSLAGPPPKTVRAIWTSSRASSVRATNRHESGFAPSVSGWRREKPTAPKAIVSFGVAATASNSEEPDEFS